MKRGLEFGMALLAALLASMPLMHARAVQETKVPAAIFKFELDDSSREGLPTQYQGPTSGERARLALLDQGLRAKLERAGYVPVNLAPIRATAQHQELWTCESQGCAATLARKAGAQVSVLGWVQKVSNLILNINLVMRDANSGRVLRAGSVDIRGDTDKSWSRGLDYLLSESILPKGKGTPR